MRNNDGSPLDVARNNDERASEAGSPALWSFTIDDDGDSFHPGLHRLTHSLKVSTLRHGLAGLRQTSHNYHRFYVGEFSGWHHTGRIIEPEREGQILLCRPHDRDRHWWAARLACKYKQRVRRRPLAGQVRRHDDLAADRQ